MYIYIIRIITIDLFIAMYFKESPVDTMGGSYYVKRAYNRSTAIESSSVHQ